MVRVHQFDSTGGAYDASQTSSEIEDGDVLIVERERVVGIMVEAWPVAVTRERGEFHVKSDDVEWTSMPRVSGGFTDYAASLRVAEMAAAAFEPPSGHVPPSERVVVTDEDRELLA